ncbi:VacJ family lipoprotein [Pseudomonas sp. B21-054]|uniref:MlaA family lipoprotein n=1 Tax=Pseudomonas sp. B21-054 TaxID=2895494 RepID=UPI00222F1B80|nr:VacJ family lipoprotein [Pseudomonas sp. B21-054]UZE20183.1 VacJ family lipoprotein [Pseudomonas sp. B21-054]
MPIIKPAPLRVGSSLVVVLAALASGCTSTPAAKPGSCESVPYTVHDPAEPINRGLFAFNRTVDDYALAPVARGYLKLPDVVQTGVHNFVGNFGEPKVFINDLLQGNAQRSVNTLGRFVINTTAGIVGLIDVSGKLGIERHKADFGQTFGVWNIAPGPIVELPLLGTANLRDATGKLMSTLVDPFGDNSDTVDTLGTVNTVGGIVDGRAQALPLTDELQTRPDYYAALRDAVAQRRADFVAQGKLGSVAQDNPHCQNGESVDES